MILRVLLVFSLVCVLLGNVLAQQMFNGGMDGRESAVAEGGLTAIIDQVSPIVGCGESVTLTATITGATEISWKRNGEFITGATTTTFVANQSGIYSVVAVSLLCQLESVPVEVIIQSPLNAAILASGGTQACEGEVVLLEATGGSAQWQWYRDGIALVDGLTEIYTATEAGTYVVAGNENSPCASVSLPVEVEIHPLPQVSLVWENNPVICAGDSLVVAASAQANLGFSWYWDESFVSDGGNTFTASQSGEYHAVVTDTQTGCSNISNTVYLEVLPQQEVEIVIDGNASMCEGASSVLLVAAGEGDVQWLSGGVPLEGMTDVFLNVFDGAEYAARITDVNGCSAVSNSLALDILPLPNVDVSITEESEVLCGANDTLHLQVEPGNAYAWYTGDVALENELGPLLEVTEPGDYFVEVTNSTGCVAISDVYSIEMVDAPEALLVPEDGATICAGQTIALEIISAQGFTFVWYLNGEELLLGNDAIVEVGAPGTYSVLVTEEHGCQTLSAAVQVETIEVATPVITGGGITGEGQLLMTDDASGHQWYLNGEMILGATSSEYLATQDGVYTVISLEDVCESALSEGFEVVLGAISEHSVSLGVYPNPCSDFLILEHTELPGSLVSIFNSEGILVRREKATQVKMYMDIRQLSAGMYQVITDAGRRVSISVVR